MMSLASSLAKVETLGPYSANAFVRICSARSCTLGTTAAFTSRPMVSTNVFTSDMHGPSLDLRKRNDDGADADLRVDWNVDLEELFSFFLVPERRPQGSFDADTTVNHRDRQRAVELDGVPLDEILDQVIH